ncbi:NAD-dependent epimerase/dehydratase family protein [Spirosoma utsteinense]|uniref:Dihydroflavonol-4-reductase n=1 Tax=Spirosoma utsteinense TaxID=2585773 RepID=A0ABR6WAQ5_9BACT|nr:NAD-dependent epimerase/dehydratase family protein [Spirosoma utsteinense]MBC3787863.1 dihydroflavonol-4-reductase [Spirosoma utsteinense]MBC3793651.1 dihydroflavonol-4-reductase [Spirosoma utsteinense]
MKTVLLTGANGFLGGHLCRELLQRGYAVRAFVRPNTDHTVLDGLPVDIWSGDLRDPANVRAATYGCDYVIHAGARAQVNPARSSEVVDCNISGTAAVLAAAVQAKVERLVYVGTATVFGFGSRKKPGDELSPYMGERYGSDYMDSKRVATDLVLRAVREDGLRAVLVHPTFMIGPLDYKITSNALLLALYRRQLKGVPMGGKNYVHVADVATATVNALTMGRIGESYILGNENLSYREAFRLMASVMNVRAPLAPVPPLLATTIGWTSDLVHRFTGRETTLNSSMTAIANDGHYFNVTKAINELNLPQTSIRAAIAEAFSWFRQRGYV